MKRIALSVLSVAVSLALTPATATASAVIGFLGNFDVINDTGSTAHGFEIELEGLHKSDITDTFGGPGRGFPTGRGFDPATSVERYGSPTIAEYTNGLLFGTRVTYMGLFNNGSWDYGTPSGSFITPGDNCWSGGGVGYGPGTPCDHFGVGTAVTPTKTTYRWLVETAPNSSVLGNGIVNLPAVVGAPNPLAGVPPLPGEPVPAPFIAQVQAPPPPESELQFGEAIWVKVFTTEFDAPPRLEDLVGDNAKIDAARAEPAEIEWQLLQTDPGNPDSGQLESGYGPPVGPNAALTVRRYEFYRYAGEYDPKNHEAKVFASDSHPEDFEIGTYLGAQNGAFAAVVPEPETYAMMLAGLGLVISMARRRNNPRLL